MKLIVISNPNDVADESIIINHLFESGLKYFHIRKPNDRPKKIEKLIERIDPVYYNCISLHQHHQLAAEFGIKRLHYTEEARKRSDAQKWQMQTHQGYTLSTSIHHTATLSSLASFDYVFYGPVFNSISKPGYQSNLEGGFNRKEYWIKPKVIALGGITQTNLSQISTMKFDGAAVLGAIWNEPDKAITNFQQIKENILFKH